MEGNIIYFKLITGEHIVSFVDAADDEFVQLHKQLQLFVQNGIGGAAVRKLIVGDPNFIHDM